MHFDSGGTQIYTLDYALPGGKPPFSRLGMLSFVLMLLVIPWAIIGAILGYGALHGRAVGVVLAATCTLPYFGAMVTGWMSIRKTGFILRNLLGILGFVLPITYGMMIVIEFGIAFWTRS